MIAYLEGTVQSVDVDELVLLVGGVGYRVIYAGFAPEVGDAIKVFVYDYVREDRRELYGFPDRPLRDFFVRMIDISGVGPRMAQKILRAGSLEDLHKHITSGNIAYLTNVPGVGKKTAQKIVLELQGVLVTDVEDGGSVQDQDTLDALMSLGYSRGDAAETIKQLTSASTDERIKEALQLLGRR